MAELKPTTTSTTSYAVLGMLSFGPSSGYDLLKFAEASVGHFWAPAKSHIYSELRRLAAAGYATETYVEQAARPDKRIYAITEEGRAELRRWLEEEPPEPEQYKSPFLLRLFFGSLADPQTLVTRVREARADAVRQLDDLRGIEERIGANDELLFPYLTLRAGLMHCETNLRWCDEVIKTLEQRRT